MAGRATAERPPIDWDEAVRLHEEEGWTCAAIAEKYDYAYKTVREGLRRRGAKPRRPVGRGKKARKLRELWRFLHEKCENPRHASYRLYGAQGVRVSPEWETFEAFYEWAPATGYRLGLRVTRLHRNGDYSPDNCLWVTRAEKRHRRRPKGRRPTILITAFGETKGMTAWTRDPRCKIGLRGLYDRLRRGWTPEEALITPAFAPRRKRGGERARS